MQSRQGTLYLAATDLANHLACGALTALDAAVARGELGAPRRFDARLSLLRERGREHERGYLGWLRSQGLAVLDLGGLGAGAALAATRRAMADGVAAIAQAALADGVWFGRPDVLRRVEHPSRLGAWSYEPYDTKLALETSGATVLQLCVYADLLAGAQGRSPARMHVVAPGGESTPDSLRVDEFLAFYRQARQALEQSVAQVDQNGASPPPAAAPYPRPVEHCDVCRWWSECDRRWHDDDHLSLVAGLGRGQEREIRAWGVGTVQGFAALPLPLDRRPVRGSLATYVALHGLAAAQVASRGLERPFWAPLDVADGQGLCRLPEPSSGDVFLDLEGDRFWSEGGGLEYLFGTLTEEGDGDEGYRYQGRWATGRQGERQAFESLVDELMERWERHPGLHVFHYGSYDAAALKRLASRHGTREEALDRLLRGERFVDLLRVVRQGLRVGVESYSLKQLEPCYGFVRQLPLKTARAALLAVDTALAERRADDLTPEVRAAVTGYNREDCLSTLHLRTWLEERRSEAIAAGAAIPRPTPPPDAPSEKLNEQQERIRALAARLLDQVPVEPAERTPEQHGRFLLAHCLEFHRREDKVGWWEFFSRIDLSVEERIDEPRAIAGLEFESRLPPVGKGKLPTDRYRFMPQEVDGRSRDAWLDKAQKLGTIESLDAASGQAEIKKTAKTVDRHPASVVLHDTFKKNAQVGALERLALWVAERGLENPADEHRAARDLLMRMRPRLRAGEPSGDLRRPQEPIVDAARRLGLELDRGVLPIQGPPGAGKTYAGAEMIVQLVKAGKRVGITATSHKVIQLLLSEAMRAADDERVALRSIRKVGDEEIPADRGTCLETDDNGRVVAALGSGEAQVAAGTSWLWSRAELAGVVDVLFIDEAGQMSLADVLAVSQAARGLVLIGDPSQLEQPTRGSHPEGTDVAALDHVLGGHETLPADRGLFLDQTWRLHPTICAFTSEQFYEGRLASLPGLERQALHAAPDFEGAGLWFLPVDHQGNTSAASEEVDAIAALLEGWFARGAEWTDRHGVRAPLGPQDVLIVAPYNAQIERLKQRLPNYPIGTVDKFQGQQAPVVIYSMTTSTPEDAPRGMEFLYSRHRLNVATSRARSACILVASPRLLAPECKAPHQMRLANALCRYVELARRV